MKNAFLIVTVMVFIGHSAASQEQLVQDINTNEADDLQVALDRDFFAKSGDMLYFSKTDEKGSELWRTDGTKEGTFRLTDINIGYGFSIRSTRYMVPVDGGLLFSAGGVEGVNGKIWKTDGTVEGTRVVAEATLEGRQIGIRSLTRIGDDVIIICEDFTVFRGYNFQAFKYSIDENSVEYLGEVGPGVINVYTAGEEAFYAARFDVNDHTTHIWSTDGTPEGSGELFTLDSEHHITDIVELENSLVINSNNRTLVKYNITTDSYSETIITDDDFVRRLYRVNSETVLLIGGASLWATGGADDNSLTTIAVSAGIPYDAGDKLYTVVWSRETTDVSLFEISKDPFEVLSIADLGSIEQFPSSIQYLDRGAIPLQDKFVTQSLSASGDEPAIVTNGNFEVLKDINPGPGSSFPRSFAAINDKVLFIARNESGDDEIWITDGTEAGTQRLLDPVTRTGDGVVREFSSFNDNAYFMALTGFNYDLWRSSPDSDGPVLVGGLNGGYIIGILNNELYTVSQSAGLTKLSASGVTTTLVEPENIQDAFTINVGSDFMQLVDKMIFPLWTPDTGYEPWVTDGTPPGTHVIKDVAGDSENSIEMTNVTGRWTAMTSLLGCMTLDDGVHGFELWKTDGTADGTQLVKDIFPGTGSSAPESMATLKGLLYFVANDNVHGKEIWKTDGTAEGTVMLSDLDPDGHSWSTNLTALGDDLLFTANVGEQGWALYKTDGSSAPVVIKQINNANGPNMIPEFFVSNGSQIFFSAGDEQHGQELWVTDGTEAGTKVIDIIAGTNGSWPMPMLAEGGEMFFSADAHLYKINNSTLEFEKLSDLEPLYIKRVVSDIYFTALSPDYGLELFRIGSIELPVGLEDETTGISIYPNPVTSTLFLNTPAALRILDLNGREIFHGSVDQSIDVSHLASGMYIAVLNDTQYIKFVKR